MEQYRIISYNNYGTECIFKGTKEQCELFCTRLNWKFIDRNKDKTTLEIFKGE